MTELLPCPFCGSTKLKIDQKKGNDVKWNRETGRQEKFVVVTVRCNKCHTRGPTTSMYASYYDSPTKALQEKAIEVWNTRTKEGEQE